MVFFIFFALFTWVYTYALLLHMHGLLTILYSITEQSINFIILFGGMKVKGETEVENWGENDHMNTQVPPHIL